MRTGCLFPSWGIWAYGIEDVTRFVPYAHDCTLSVAMHFYTVR